MLNKDPYLGSQIKHRSFSTVQPLKNPTQFTSQQLPKQSPSYTGQPFRKQEQKTMKDVIHTYERQNRSLSEAYKTQEETFRKVANLHYVNKEYNEAMKQRNYELNAKLNDLAYERSLMAQKHDEQIMRNTYDKDMILKKYEQQNEEIIRLKRSNAQLLQQKARLESQIDHLMFLMQKDSHQGSLEIKEQIIRMENMQRTLRGIVDTKDAQITQLRHRMKVYEDENRRLNDLNKTLTITRQQKIDNLSNISHMDSNIKSHNKENMDINRRDDYLISELNQQKEINKQLLSEITLMKKKLFEEPSENLAQKQSQVQKKNQKRQESQLGQVHQKIDELSEIRRGINSKIYDVYCKSIKQGEKQKKNSLLIFIENYKRSNINSSLSSINQYMTARDELKSLWKSSQNSQVKSLIEMELPMKLNSRQHSQDSEWVLSTIQLTKNQKNEGSTKRQNEVGQGNSAILFLFRLLTIEYRTKNTTEGKKMQHQKDVQNELLHSIVKATQTLIQLE